MWVIRRISIILQPNCKGEMLEWLKRHAWKACIPQKGIPSSNLGLSAPFLMKVTKKSVD